MRSRRRNKRALAEIERIRIGLRELNEKGQMTSYGEGALAIAMKLDAILRGLES